jgi:hypothetical protein
VNAIAAQEASPSSEVARHYGNMRFAMFTVFSTVSGALIAFPFSQAGSTFLQVAGAPHHRTALCLAGLVLSCFFTAAEWRISYLVTFYQEAAFNDRDFPRPNNHAGWKLVVAITMVLPHLLAAGFWLAYLGGSIAIPPMPK